MAVRSAGSFDMSASTAATGAGASFADFRFERLMTSDLNLRDTTVENDLVNLEASGVTVRVILDQKEKSTNQAAYNMNVEGYILHNESSAIATAQKGVSVEASLVRNAAVTALLNKASIRLLSTDSAVLDKAGIMLKKASLTLFG